MAAPWKKNHLCQWSSRSDYFHPDAFPSFTLPPNPFPNPLPNGHTRARFEQSPLTSFYFFFSWRPLALLARISSPGSGLCQNSPDRCAPPPPPNLFVWTPRCRPPTDSKNRAALVLSLPPPSFSPVERRKGEFLSLRRQAS